MIGLLTERAPFTVNEVSQFRLYCEAPDTENDVDIDFHLLENEEIVGSSISNREEEEITYTLQPGKSYALVVYHFLPFTGTFRCMSYSLELSISPFDNGIHTCTGQSDNLPAINLM